MTGAEKIYRDAIKLAAGEHARNLEDFMRGDRFDSGTPLMDLERQFVIEAIAQLLARPGPHP